MDKGWSEKNKQVQTLLNKKDTFRDAIRLLMELRADVFNQITQIMNGYPKEAFYQMPFSRHHIMHVEAMRRINNGFAEWKSLDQRVRDEINKN